MTNPKFSALDPAARALASLKGKELDAALNTRFNLTETTVAVGEGSEAQEFQIIKPANADHLISEADYVHDERLPYWADLWPSARVLAGVLLKEDGSNRTLLEMGCGLGLSTIAAIKAGFQVTSTDYYEDALHVTRSNALHNVGAEPAVQMVNWRDWPNDLSQFDVVIAADVLYEKEYAALVANCIAKALKPDGVAIVADPGRLALPAFRESIIQNQLTISNTTLIPFAEDKVKQTIQIMWIRWNNPTAAVA